MRQDLYAPKEKELLYAPKIGKLEESNERQYQSRTYDKIRKTRDYLTDVSAHSHNLSGKKFRAELNAGTLYEFISNILLIPDEDNRLNSKSDYNFPTVELARMITDVMLQFLKESTLFQKNISIQSDINKVLQHFKTLSEFILTNEIDAKMSRKERQEDSDMSKEYASYISDSIKLLAKANLKNKIKEEEIKLFLQHNDVDVKQYQEIKKRLESKYKVLEQYASPINPLSQFNEYAREFLKKKRDYKEEEIKKYIPKKYRPKIVYRMTQSSRLPTIVSSYEDYLKNN